jgi:peroxiredoxin
MELDALGKATPVISSLGATLVAVSPQLEEHSRALMEKKDVPFEILSDPGNGVARTYGIVFTMPEDLKEVYLGFGLNVAAHNGDDTWTLPLPARFIIDRDGIIRYAQIDVDYTVRPDPEHTIEALRAIVGESGLGTVRGKDVD